MNPPTEAEIRAEIARRGGVVVPDTLAGFIGPSRYTHENCPLTMPELAAWLRHGVISDALWWSPIPVGLWSLGKRYKSDKRRTEAAVKLIQALWEYSAWTCEAKSSWYRRCHLRIADEVIAPRVPKSRRSEWAYLVKEYPEEVLSHPLARRIDARSSDKFRDAIVGILIEEAAK